MAASDQVGYSTGTPRVRLMVVDDEPAIREVMADVLASEGYDVLTAEDGLDALTRLVDPLPDVIISDLRMPRMSGLELLAAVREQFPHVPVIVISGEFGGHAPPHEIPADACLPKGGYTIAQLCAKITQLISASLARRQAGATGPAQLPA